MKRNTMALLAAATCFGVAEIPPLLAQSLADGLVAYYPFNGNANDESGHEDHGQVLGASLSEDRFGRVNSAYWFTRNELNAIKTSGINIPRGLGESTFSLWFRQSPAVVGDFLHAPLFSIFEDSPSLSLFLAEFWGTALEIRTVSDTLGFGYKGYEGPNQPFADGNWHQLVTVVRSNRLDVYFDSNPVVWVLLPPPPTSWTVPDGDFWIGYSPNSYYDGGLDDIRVYSRALDSDEVAQLYSQEAVLPEERLSIHQAIELEFLTNVGFRYLLESSVDLSTWSPWGDVFDGTGETTNILVSIRNTEMTYWRLIKVQ